MILPPLLMNKILITLKSFRHEEYLDNIDKYYNMFNNNFHKKMAEIKTNTDDLNEMEDLLKRFNSALNSVGVSNSSLPPRLS